MHCINDEKEAKGICINCGKALCENCMEMTPSHKVVCSKECMASIHETDLAASMILQKAVNGALASAYGSFLLGALMLLFAFVSKDSFLKNYMGAFGIGLILFGSFYFKVAHSKKKLTSR